ncbi:IS110 family transposase [Lacticaseibacillus suilingensis]|uniref:IS110 family transposase n=1 Tax=Lacticaseibacillus suilingensis TaxID=2799577 RepID=UPI001F16049A|nr:IS110 family transposase [Lacticaseibacillus suilingensis]
MVIFEATGVYSRRVAAFFQREGLAYTQINPLQAKRAMEDFRSRKNDVLDAEGLARAMARYHFAPTYQEKPVYGELRDLERTYQQHNEDIVRAKNRLHRSLQMTFPEIEHVLSSTDGLLYWHLVQRFPHPDAVLACEMDELTRVVMESTPKNMGLKRAQRIAGKLWDLAQLSAPAAVETDYIVKATTFQAQEVARLDQLKAATIVEMAVVAKGLSEVQILMSIPGIGEKTALCLLAELGDVRRFHSANAINAYVGIDLIQYQSGNYNAEQHIRKRGNAYARKIMYRAIINIVSAARYRPTRISAAYKRKKQSSQFNRTKKIAVAAMSQLNRLIRHLILNNEPYDKTAFCPEP